MNTTRSDLINPGIFIPDKSDTPADVRPAPVFLSDNHEVVPAVLQVEGFGLDGRPTTVESDMAAKRETGNVTTCWVRYSKAGADKGRLLNPRGVHFSESDFRSKKKSRGSTRYEFREISSDAFILYVQYLNNHSEGVLREVERLVASA